MGDGGIYLEKNSILPSVGQFRPTETKEENMSRKPRLTQDERLLIQEGLNAGKSVYRIAKELKRPIRTICREIAARSVTVNTGAPFRGHNRCVHRATCEIRRLCAHCPKDHRVQCRTCAKCNGVCRSFEEYHCPKLDTPHFVCNSCGERHRCVLRKRLYQAIDAHSQYRTILSESRSGITMGEEELAEINKILVLAKENRQSLYAITRNNPDICTVSDKTLYRYVDAGLLELRRHDLNPKLIGKRRRKSVEHKVDAKCRIGRKHEDYRRFIEENPGVPVVEMDTVEGRKGEKVLLTLMFMPYGFMVAILLEDKLSRRVTEAFDEIFRKLAERHGEERAKQIYHQLFRCVLTDNGTEFTNPATIERGEDGRTLARLFYCEPGSSWQKAHVENNHSFIRRYLPKGDSCLETVSFNPLTQEKVDLMMSHINSYVRRELDGACPYDNFVKVFGEETAALLGVTRIPANEIVLHPSLIGVEQKVKADVLAGTEGSTKQKQRHDNAETTPREGVKGVVAFTISMENEPPPPRGTVYTFFA